MFVIIGASGFLGRYIIQYIIEKKKDSVIATARHLKNIDMSDKRVHWHYCDVRSEESVNALADEIKMNEHVDIIYLAAYHHPEEVEANKVLAWDINVTSLSRFVSITGFADHFYYVSTDNVYGESFDNYRFRETDKLNPVNFYGHCKCAAEAVTVHFGRNVVRLPFLISPSLADKKHFYDKIVDTISQNKEIEMYADSFRSTLGFDQAAELIIELIGKNREHQIVNVCGDDKLSKYDVGVMIANRERLDSKLIIPVTAEDSEAWNQVRRARSTLMDNTLVKNILGIDKIRLFEDILIS